ncbi:MAG: hypothetical protein VB058_05915 [Oscillospiraceae bacterium]|nr:hypothetical protein [Oscillospiraceae bacterium]
MSCEKENFRDSLDRLSAKYPGREFITISESCELIGCHRETIMHDKNFPLRRVGRRCVVPLVPLARWMS